jgi:hypothetical protein
LHEGRIRANPSLEKSDLLRERRWAAVIAEVTVVNRALQSFHGVPGGAWEKRIR